MGPWESTCLTLHYFDNENTKKTGITTLYDVIEGVSDETVMESRFSGSVFTVFN